MQVEVANAVKHKGRIMFFKKQKTVFEKHEHEYKHNPMVSAQFPSTHNTIVMFLRVLVFIMKSTVVCGVSVVL